MAELRMICAQVVEDNPTTLCDFMNNEHLVDFLYDLVKRIKSHKDGCWQIDLDGEEYFIKWHSADSYSFISVSTSDTTAVDRDWAGRLTYDDDESNAENILISLDKCFYTLSDEEL